MTASALRVLLIDGNPDTRAVLQARGFAVEDDPERARGCDATVFCAETDAALAALAQRPDLAGLAFDQALVVVAGAADEALETRLLQAGVEAIVLAEQRAALPRALRHALLRKQLARANRTAYATDLATGLPHQAQLLEHMNQLLALREREPAPMVLLVLRVEGYAAAAAVSGAEAANVMRRKVAVRLRSGLRASDVVAAIAPDRFGVLLGRLQARGDGERVAAKLLRALEQPITVAGRACSIQASVGLALYPDHGKDALSLLQRANAQAGSLVSMGAEGRGAVTEGQRGVAANDARDASDG